MTEDEFNAEAVFLERVGLVERWAADMLGADPATVLIGAAMRLWAAEGGKAHALAMARVTIATFAEAEGLASEAH